MIEEVSTITAKGQTTVPKAVRKALGVDLGGQIAFRVGSRGVTVHRVDEEGDDPVIGRFLDFVARDLAKRPEAVSDLPPALLDRVRSLTAGIDVDPDDAIEGEVAI